MRGNELRLGLVCAVSQPEVLHRCLLASPALADMVEVALPMVLVPGAGDAASVLAAAQRTQLDVDWWLWVHQDVVLPAGWFAQFKARLAAALQRWPDLAVVSDYGMTDDGERAGHVLDRERILREPTPLPCLAAAVDEHLLAVRCSSGLGFDAALGFDLYGTDVVLTARAAGLTAAVLDVFCEHRATTPRLPPYPQALVARYRKSAVYFEAKWQAQLPLHTPSMSFPFAGAAAQQCDALPVAN